MLTLVLAVVAAWAANLLYANYSRTRVSRAEFRLILRRSWIPGYLVYHDGLFVVADVTRLHPVFIIHERVMWEMVRQMSSSRDPWRVVGPQRSGYFPPLSVWSDPGWQSVALTLLAFWLVLMVRVLWEVLGVVAMVDKSHFTLQQQGIPAFYLE